MPILAIFFHDSNFSTASALFDNGSECENRELKKTLKNRKIDNSLNIGIAISLTGRHSHIGSDQEIGVKIAERYFNRVEARANPFPQTTNPSPGVNGIPLKFNYVSADSTIDAASKAFDKLINARRKNVAIIGPTLSDQAFIVDEKADENCILVLAPSNTAEGIPQIGKYVSRVSAGVEKFVKYSFSYAVKQIENVNNIAVVYAGNDKFTESEAESYIEYIESQDYTEPREIIYDKNSQDFSETVDQILDDQKYPDIVVISGLTSDGGNIIYSLRERGYEGIIIGGNGLNARQVFEFCKQHCNGVIVAQSYNYKNPNYINREFLSIYNQIKNKDMPEYPTQFTAQMFTAIQVIAESLKEIAKSNNLERMSLYELRTKLNSIHLSGRTFNTPLGTILFDEDGDIDQHNGFSSSTIRNVLSDGTGGFFENNR